VRPAVPSGAEPATAPGPDSGLECTPGISLTPALVPDRSLVPAHAMAIHPARPPVQPIDGSSCVRALSRAMVLEFATVSTQQVQVQLCPILQAACVHCWRVAVQAGRLYYVPCSSTAAFCFQMPEGLSSFRSPDSGEAQVQVRQRFIFCFFPSFFLCVFSESQLTIQRMERAPPHARMEVERMERAPETTTGSAHASSPSVRQTGRWCHGGKEGIHGWMDHLLGLLTLAHKRYDFFWMWPAVCCTCSSSILSGLFTEPHHHRNLATAALRMLIERCERSNLTEYPTQGTNTTVLCIRVFAHCTVHTGVEGWQFTKHALRRATFSAATHKKKAGQNERCQLPPRGYGGAKTASATAHGSRRRTWHITAAYARSDPWRSENMAPPSIRSRPDPSSRSSPSSSDGRCRNVNACVLGSWLVSCPSPSRSCRAPHPGRFRSPQY
jgi:hypothetical protein